MCLLIHNDLANSLIIVSAHCSKSVANVAGGREAVVLKEAHDVPHERTEMR